MFSRFFTKFFWHTSCIIQHTKKNEEARVEDKSLPAQQPRIGFHYFPDTMHYRESDLIRWIPILQSLGTSWLTLYAPDDHAIPEPFIGGLKKARIQPIIHFHSSITKPPEISDIKSLLKVYASWGIRYVVFFDRPNQLSEWTPTDWAQDKLVERYLDVYLPRAEQALSTGLLPVLTPLEPGGNYWDTAFLSDLFSAISRRGYLSLINHMVLSAYARTGNRPLNWGAGGPERWPSTRPYITPKESQDQCGFRIFDWYLAITKGAIGKTLPIILFGVGFQSGDIYDHRFPAITLEAHTARHMEISRALAVEDSKLETLPSEIIACNFWPLCTAPGHPKASHAWYQADGYTLPIVDSMRAWVQSHHRLTNSPIPPSGLKRHSHHPIAHYLLLTEELWGKSGKTSAILRAFLQKYKPTIGFSPSEAVLARRVTILGSSHAFPDAVVDKLIEAGCVVERIQEDGTVLASQAVES